MESLGLIAGDGRLPIEIAGAARAGGMRVVGVGFPGITAVEFADACDQHVTLHLGEIEKLLRLFSDEGIRRAVVAGKVSKQHLIGAGGELRLDDTAKRLLAELADRRDDSILSGFAAALESVGVDLAPQAELVPTLLAGSGTLGRIAPTPAQAADAVFGWDVAKRLGAVDVGQSVVVRQRAVMAVEAIEGTDEAIRRGGRLGGPGATVVKVTKPGQDPRFDLPAVGVGTISALEEVAAGMLAVEAGGTLVLEREAMIAAADDAGIAVVGVTEDWIDAERNPGTS